MNDEFDNLCELPPDIEAKFETTIKKLHQEGRLPSLERVTEVLLQVRTQYREKLLKTRAAPDSK